MPEVKFLGHSCVTINNGDHKLIIDPYLSDNPCASCGIDDIDANWVLVTHGHGDHIGDAMIIAKKNDATIIANFEICNLVGGEGCKFHPLHIGGGFNFSFGRVKMTQALHGGGYGPDASRYTGPATGFLVYMDGKTIYHPGDTGLFLDMKLIGEMNDIDLAFLPIGDNFTMGIDDAVRAVEFLNPKKVVPIHFDTFDVIKADPNEFASKVIGSEVVILEPGQGITV